MTRLRTQLQVASAIGSCGKRTLNSSPAKHASSTTSKRQVSSGWGWCGHPWRMPASLDRYVGGASDAGRPCRLYRGRVGRNGVVGCPLPCAWPVTEDMLNPPHWPVTPTWRSHVGEAVAVVLADDRYIAADAVGEVVVDYEPLDPVASLQAATTDEVRPPRPRYQQGVHLGDRRGSRRHPGRVRFCRSHGLGTLRAAAAHSHGDGASRRVGGAVADGRRGHAVLSDAGSPHPQGDGRGHHRDPGAKDPGDSASGGRRVRRQAQHQRRRDLGRWLGQRIWSARAVDREP